jgi:arylsulfatase A-like enzyme
MGKVVRTRVFPAGLVLALVAGFLFAFAGLRAEAKPGDRTLPNVVLISADTLRQASVRAFEPGAGELPHLDGLSSRARVFSNAYASASWTLPSTASLMTGLYPDRHGATDRRLKLAPRLETLSQRMQVAGYETVAYTDGAFVDGGFGFHKGFERYDQAVSPRARQTQRVRLPRGGRPHAQPGAALFDRAVAFLRQRALRQDERRPLFLFLQSYTVHEYWRVRPWAAREVSGVELRDSDYYSDCLQGKRSCSKADWRALEALYEAEVRHFDTGFGRLLAAMERVGLDENTLIVFLSDHGEGFETGRIHHGGRLHHDQLRVPLLVAGPGVVPGVTDVPVSLVDVMPTLLEWVGHEAPEDLDGASFAAALRGSELPGARPALAMEHSFLWEDGRRVEVSRVESDPLSLAVIHGDDWYIRGAAAEEELYDVGRDAEQVRNLAPGSSRLGTLRSLAARRSTRRGSLMLADTTPELAEQLRTLGYVQ